MEKRFKIKINSSDNIEVLLQEIYDEACRHFNEVQNEINKLANSTNLGDESVTIDDKTKYAKSMHDFLGDKNRAISMKLEVAKFLGEIIKHQGNVDDALSDKKFAKRSNLDLAEIRAKMNNGSGTDSYTLK